MREGIPSLRVLCLRAIGSHACSAEDTFAPTGGPNPNSTLSTASRLLRSYHLRPVVCVHHHVNTSSQSPTAASAAKKISSDAASTTTDDDEDSTATAAAAAASLLLPASCSCRMDDNDDKTPSIYQIPIRRAPCAGKGSSRRLHVNDVDLHHPFCGIRPGKRNTNSSGSTTTSSTTAAAATSSNPTFIMQYGNPALDALQSYVDALVEMGRMDDSRLGRHFFEEYKANIILGNTNTINTKNNNRTGDLPAEEENEDEEEPLKKKRRTTPPRGANNAAVVTTTTSTNAATSSTAATLLPLGSLSLHHCSLSFDSIEAAVASGIGPHLAVLDLTGIQGLSDDMASTLLRHCPNLRRLSIKNGRRLTVKTLQVLTTTTTTSTGAQQSNLHCLDIGGCFNITVNDILEQILPQLPVLTELHASGIGWRDDHLAELLAIRVNWKALSIGFSTELTAAKLRQYLPAAADTLQSLALPFCENLVDNALLGMLGRNLPNIEFLDLRGNPSLSTLTGWYDGRASADLPAQPLTVLGRYSGLSEASVEETIRIHPIETVGFTVVLDGRGSGLAIGYEEETDVLEVKAGPAFA